MSKKRIKQYLMLLTVIGLVSIASGSGTFASFTAETTNPGNFFQTGSLFLHNTNTGVTCTSESSNTNSNPGTGVGGDTCHTLFTVSATNSHAQYAFLTLKNAGTINASDIKFTAGSPACQNARAYDANTTLNGPATSGTNSITVNATTVAIQSGGDVQISDGANTEDLTTSAAVPVGSVTIPFSSNLAHNHANGIAVNSSADFGASNLCAHVEFSITETDSVPTVTEADTGTTGADGCAYGTSQGTNDGCLFDSLAGHTLSTLPSNTLTPLTLKSAVNGNAGTGLDAGKSRYFVIGIIPNAVAVTNADQDTKATFDLTWHIDQA